MPCTQCKEGKYKWGETGECEYDSKEDCESANHKYNKMRPTPLGKTYEEYAKELKEYNLSKVERVELGITEDFKGILKASNNNYKNSENMVSEASTINGVAVKILEKQIKLDKTADEINKNADNLWKEFQGLAKDLGINPKDTPAYKTYNEILSDLLSRSNEKSVLNVLTMRLN